MESLFSKDDEPSKDTIMAMRFKYEPSDDSSEDEFGDIHNKFDVLDICPMELCQEKSTELNLAPPPSPNAKIYIL
ncbi:hypothetical protein LIER_42128 [Lithospermum erythrorhizon]|uniref:Uncharacterized protein n=1 Tax=Lithospermum erythrorhizon TaxID=34254 RepID=A0AAV3RNZ7_LITER